MDGLPFRYETPLRAGFDREIGQRLGDGISILDIGSGRHPAIPVNRRPAGAPFA